MYYRSRSPMHALPEDRLRYADLERRMLERRIDKLEVDVRNLSKDLQNWRSWESYLYQVWFWARDVAAVLAKFPWLWSKPRVGSGRADETGMVDP